MPSSSILVPYAQKSQTQTKASSKWNLVMIGSFVFAFIYFVLFLNIAFL